MALTQFEYVLGMIDCMCFIGGFLYSHTLVQPVSYVYLTSSDVVLPPVPPTATWLCHKLLEFYTCNRGGE